MSKKRPEEMTDTEFDCYLKRNRITGMAAVAASRRRRQGARIAAQYDGVKPYSEEQLKSAGRAWRDDFIKKLDAHENGQ